MEFKRSVLKVNVYGEKVEMTYPTVSQYRGFNKEVNKAEKSEFDLTLDFLVSLGFKRELGEDMEPAHLTKIINTLTGTEEKK